MAIGNEAYIFKYGQICPNCESDHIETLDSVTIDPPHYATQAVMCSSCDATWDDIYNLTGYENLEIHERNSKDGTVSTRLN
jgi:hypothetical protein